MSPEDTKAIETKFWARVDKGPGCWEWTGTRLQAGYGKFQRNGPPALAHRISWQLTYGPIPDGLFVLHHCDNPPCVKPDHLFLGTHADNMRDRNAKGRSRGGSPPGELNAQAKLSEEQVLEIRRRFDSAESCGALAKEFSVSYFAIWDIGRRRRWKHLVECRES